MCALTSFSTFLLSHSNFETNFVLSLHTCIVLFQTYNLFCLDKPSPSGWEHRATHNRGTYFAPAAEFSPRLHLRLFSSQRPLFHFLAFSFCFYFQQIIFSASNHGFLQHTFHNFSRSSSTFGALTALLFTDSLLSLSK